MNYEWTIYVNRLTQMGILKWKESMRTNPDQIEVYTSKIKRLFRKPIIFTICSMNEMIYQDGTIPKHYILNVDYGKYNCELISLNTDTQGNGTPIENIFKSIKDANPNKDDELSEYVQNILKLLFEKHRIQHVDLSERKKYNRRLK